MSVQRTTRTFLSRRGLTLGASLMAVALVAACDSSPTDPNDNGHVDAARVEIHTRGAASALLAVWTDGAGWADASGNPITELPNPIDVEGEGLLPMQTRGRNASLTVRFFMPDGSQVPMSTVSRDDVTRERQCSEYEARYAPTDTNTQVIAWPNMRHPDSPNGPFQFARQGNGNLVAVFHCDHIHFYPDEVAGTVGIQFLLWHIDHADEVTDPINIRVEEGPEPARFELQTRGAASAMLGVWDAWNGWRDASGQPITSIPAPRDVEGEGLRPLVAGGGNASLTVRYFAPGGEQVPFSTVSREADAPRERTCSTISGRYAVAGGATNAIAWPPQAHPNGVTGDDQFAPRADNSLVPVFHCDHIHIYPEAVGEVDLYLVAWDGSAAVAQTDPITFQVTGGQ